jgi:hypothetical protein
MYLIKLKKIESTHENLRTDEINGMSHDLPEVGQSFTLIADPLERANPHKRVVTTTPVVKVTKTGNEMVFETANSVYSIEYEEISNLN